MKYPFEQENINHPIFTSGNDITVSKIDDLSLILTSFSDNLRAFNSSSSETLTNAQKSALNGLKTECAELILLISNSLQEKTRE